MHSHPVNPLKILVAGGGIAGLMTAFLLEQDGHKIEIIERESKWNCNGGGITLMLNGMKLLREIGVGQQLEAYGLPISDIRITDSHNNKLSKFDLKEFSEVIAPTITIHRQDLHHVLSNNLKNSSVYFNRSVQSIQPLTDKVKITFSNGEAAEYDIVIGSDGMYSDIREKLFPKTRIRYSGYVCWRFVLDMEQNEMLPSTLTEMWGKGKRFGIVPLNNNRIHCFASVNTNHPDQMKLYSVNRIKALFKDFEGIVPNLLEKLNENTHIMFSRIEEVKTGEWVKGRVVLIADAAHGMTPNITQGASLAVEDAFVLSRLLKNCNDIQESLKEFQSLRKIRVTRIKRKSALLGRVGQLQMPVLASVRNYLWKYLPDKWIQNDFEKLLVHGI